MLHASRISLMLVHGQGKGEQEGARPTFLAVAALYLSMTVVVLLLVSMAVGRRLMDDAEWRQSVRAARMRKKAERHNGQTQG